MGNADGEQKQLEVLELLTHFKGRLEAKSIDFLQDRPKVLEPVKKLLALYKKAEGDRKKKEKSENKRGNLSDFLDWHKVHEKGSELWTHLMSAAIADIDPNAKGHSALLKYLKAATEFEDLLYGLELFYRDHTLHSLWVYLIGVKLMGKGGELEPIAENLNWYVYNDVYEKENPDPLVSWASLEEECLNHAIQEKKDAIWCIMALCHDLGYSLEKLKKLNEKVQAVLKYYDVSDFRHVGYTLDLEHQYLVTQCLELMAMEVRLTPGNDYPKASEGDTEKELVNCIKRLSEEDSIKELLKGGLDRDTLRKGLMKAVSKECVDGEDADSDRGKVKDLALRVYENVLTKCFREDSSYWRLCKAFERKEHGVLSAYLLFKTVGLFADVSVRSPAEGWGLDDDEAIDNIIRGDILFAIAQHEFAFAHIDQMSGLAEILILCDELEEFSRLGRQLLSRKYHDTTAETGVEVKFDPEDEKDPCEVKVIITMTYDSRHEDRGEFVEFCDRKAGRLCKLFSLGSEEKKAYRIGEIKTTFNYNDIGAGSEMGYKAIFSMKDKDNFAVEVRTPNGTKEAALECRDDDIYVRDNGTDTDLKAWLKGKECFNIKDKPATIAKS